MNGDKKQKMMLGGLVVLLLGMGSWWFVFRDTGPEEISLTKAGSGEAKKRERKGKDEKSKTRERRKKRTVAVESTKKVREKTERKSKKSNRRTRKGVKINKKKKTQPPAACLPPREDWLEDFDPSEYNPPMFT